MASRKNFRSAGFAGLIALVLVLAGCSTSSDPDNWVDADAAGKIQENFIRACTEADDGVTSNASSLADYCGCSYDDLRDDYDADFEGFKTINSDLGSDPDAIPPNVRTILENCASAHLGS
jgi:hypothetical protein